MRRMEAAGAALIALAALCGAMLLAGALLAPRPWLVQAGAPGDAYVFTDTYPPERGETPLRWTREAAGLRLHGAYAGPIALELRLYRDPAAAAAAAGSTALRAGATELGSFAATAGWRRYALALPPGVALSPLTLTSTTFQPGGGDARELGLAIGELRARPLAGAAPLGYALGRAAWFAALLGLAGAAAWLLDAWCLGAAGERGRPWRALAFVAGLGGTLALWAWLGPLSLAWALPTRWVAVGLGGAAVGALAAGVALAGRAARAPAEQGGLRPRQATSWAALGALILAHLALMAPLSTPWRGAAALLILLTPGALAALALLWEESDLAERLFLGAAGGIAVAAPLVLALHALPGPAQGWALLLAADLLSGLGLWALWRGQGTGHRAQGTGDGGSPRQGSLWHPPPGTRHPARPHRWLALALILGATVRLWGLGVAQFQGDEAYAMMLAKGVLHGQDDILLLHMKGPVEALLPAGVLVLTGAITEAAARLPFALASVALIAGVWSLAGRLLGGRAGDLAGFAAAAGVAADGLLVAFGRILQYQAVVMLLSAAALWLCWRFYEGAAARRTLPAAACCAAVAILAHYDGAYVAPALAWLVVAGGRRRGWGGSQWAGALAAPIAIGLVLSLSFYLPFVLHEHFGRTLSHLATRSGQGGSLMFYNNLPGYGAMLSVYATRYVAIAVPLALLGSLAALLVRYLRPPALGSSLAGLLLIGCLLSLLAPGALAAGPDASLAALLIVPPLLALALAPRLPMALRALVLWHGAALAAHAFLLADPRTHFYTAHPAGWLIVGWGIAALWERAGAARPALGRALRGAVAAGGATLATLALSYVGMVFLRPSPEYERAYPGSMLPFFQPLSGERLPDDGIFGFPARDGWKTAEALFERGVLRGSIDSNQELFTAGWYLRGQFRCQRNPDYFLTANGVTPLFIPQNYNHVGTVVVDGVRSLEIYSRSPRQGPVVVYDAADFAGAFDAAPVPNFPLRRLLSGVAPQVRFEPAWAAGFGLRGFDLDQAEFQQDDSAFLTLYWRAAAELPDTLVPQVFLRDTAGNGGEAPSYCGGTPAEAWHANYVNDTSFRIDGATLAPGAYSILLGVRDLATGALLPLPDGDTLVELGAITVR
jgi:hypothetical protein